MNNHLAIAKLNSTIDPLADLDKFGFASIDDGAAAAITGGASATIDAKANAYGSYSQTYTQASTTATTWRPFSVAVGEGVAVAIGNNPSSSVNPFGTGDKVRTISGQIDIPGQSISIGAVLAYSRN